MKQMLWFVILLYCVAAAQTFDSAKRREEVKITDQVIAVRVPVEIEPALRPLIPQEIRELRKLDIVLYDSDEAASATYAIVIMVIPAEHAAEMTKRLGEHPSVELLTEQEVRELGHLFSQSVASLDQLKNRVLTALTPIPTEK